MLGSWSFGDYFKEEAIDMAWELLTDVYKLPQDQIYATYFGGDKELGLEPDNQAKDLWLRFLPPSHVIPGSKKDNFWEMGDQGPCGPCSEIHFDRIGGRDASSLVNNDDPNVLEIWNLVFMQFNRDATGLNPLPASHVDTGMGLERLVSVLQDKRSNYDTDAFSPLLQAVQEVTGAPPYAGLVSSEEKDKEGVLRDTAYRVVVDHLRTLCFALADGAMPSNEGRGYVLRRILRRAVRYAQQILNAKKGFFSELVPVMVKEYGDSYPELKIKQKEIVEILQDEEGSFSSMLERGVRHFESLAKSLQKQQKTTVPGSEAFFLYDSLGFPLDLTQLMAEEKGLVVDTSSFQTEMQKQKQASRDALARYKMEAQGTCGVDLNAQQVAWLRDNGIQSTDDSQKFEWDIKPSAEIAAIFDPKTKKFADKLTDDMTMVGIVLSNTPFYPEAGGQVADIGSLKADSGSLLRVLDTKAYAGYVVHVCEVSKEALEEGIAVSDKVTCSVDYERRRDVAPNHTMTHVLNWALRKHLGETVDQRGSLVDNDKLRFDFSFKRALKSGEVEEVQESVRKVIGASLDVDNKVIALEDAIGINGLRAVFGETYPDPVRVVSVGTKISDMQGSPKEEGWQGYSVELCGGTHISNTAEAEDFVITEETAIAKGVRRLVALTRSAARRAEACGSELASRVSDLASKSISETLSRELNSLKEEIDQAEMSASLKPKLRDQLSEISKKIVEQKKKRLAVILDAEILYTLEAASQAQDAGAPALVQRVNLGLDAKTINKVANAVSKNYPELAFMAISEEEPGSGGPVLCVSVIPHSAVERGLVASEWNAAALEGWGPKGGGKPTSAQARAGACSDVEGVAMSAREYAYGRLIGVSAKLS
ncbi:hypothetical protein AAMO2058_000394100 [Amorphochlora amoebiformis]